MLLPHIGLLCFTGRQWLLKPDDVGGHCVSLLDTLPPALGDDIHLCRAFHIPRFYSVHSLGASDS